jgi:hypothetical protein
LIPNFDKFSSDLIVKLGKKLEQLDKSIRAGTKELFHEIDFLVLRRGLALDQDISDRIATEKNRLRERRMFRYY